MVANVPLKRSKAEGAGWLAIAASWAFAVVFGVFTAIACGSPDAYPNPAFTLGMAISSGDFSKFWPFLAAQMLGAVVGAVLVWLHFLPHWGQTEDPSAELACFSTMLSIPNFGANLLSEMIGTFVLMLGAAAIFSKKVAIAGPAAALGPFLVGVLVWAIGPSLGGMTGYAINPARDLGPRIAHAFLPLGTKVGSGWNYAAVPVIGPLGGSCPGGSFRSSRSHLTTMSTTITTPSIPRISPLAGKPAPKKMPIDVAKLERGYFERRPDVNDPNQMVSFGTSGHRGSSLDGAFTEAHIIPIRQAICDYRRANGPDGPLYLGKDTHAVSDPAQCTALEVLAANGVDAVIQHNNGVTPTLVISRAILAYNRGRKVHFADGIVITPSHNPPKDGGFKYNPPNGGPADTDVTQWVEGRANELLRAKNAGVKRVPFASAINAPTTHQDDFVRPYVRDLRNVIDMDAIRAAGLRLAVDPLGGASLPYWGSINEEYQLDVAVVNEKIDPTFSFMTVDHDGVIRMDCSSPYAMVPLVRLKDKFALAFGNDPDSDRHGIVPPSARLMNPNHYLSAAIRYLLTHRPLWAERAIVGNTLVSGMIDRVVLSLGRRLNEVPVGFKWFVPGLFDGSCCFGGEESAGASFVRLDGSVWTTDKQGLIMNLLAAEIAARTGKNPGEHYRDLTAQFGTPFYARVDAPATPEQKAKLRELTPESVTASTLAGEPILNKLARAPGESAPAARPSGTENICKMYAESFTSQSHLDAVNNALNTSRGRA